VKRTAIAALIVALATLPVLAGPIMRIALKNASDKTIVEAYVVVAGSDWDKPVDPGKRAQLILQDGADKCVADLRLVAGDGTEFERRVVFCGNPNFTYYGR
jgi:hypothetical protein